MREVNFNQLLLISIAMSKERDRDCLLETILTQAMAVTGCDSGTLYTRDTYGLKPEVTAALSQQIRRGGAHGEIGLPALALSESDACAYAAIHNRLLNLEDVYLSDQFDFSAERDRDADIGYRTASMLVVPMEDGGGEPVGVLRLVNAQDEDGNVTAFDPLYEQVVLALASQAAICLTNLTYAGEMRRMVDGCMEVVADAIDRRSPFSAGHSRNMASYAVRFLDWLDHTHSPLAFSQGKRAEFLLSVWLHDIGKISVPLPVLDKEDRLGARQADVLRRFDFIALTDRLVLAEGRIDAAEAARRKEKLETARKLVSRCNTADLVTDDDMAALFTLQQTKWEDADGMQHHWLTPDEMTCLAVRQGVLTAEERAALQGHLDETVRMLAQMYFPAWYTHVPLWTGAHHELLNGKGYPGRLAGKAIPIEARLLTVIDQFDELTAHNRPGQPALPVHKALDELMERAEKGELDGALVLMFQQARPWLRQPGKRAE